MYKLHGDLKALFKPYSITPGAALAELMIPIYNLWGVWDVFATMADQFKSRGGRLAESGAALRFWLPLLYIGWLGGQILNRVVAIQSRDDRQPSVTLVLVSTAVEVFLWYVWLEMAREITEAIAVRVKEVQSPQNPPNTTAEIPA
jgi:hypothetical protein